MLAPEEFREEYPPEELEDELPDDPVTSLRDVQYLYGRLYTLATAGGGDYAAYLTPDQASDLFDDSESLIAVRLDFSGDEPRLAEDPVYVTAYGEELVEEVAHCKYDAARGIDHSVTHRSGRNSDPEKLAGYAAERVSKWATEDVVQSAVEDHEEGWIVEWMAELATDETALDRIRDTVTERLGGSTTALLTVQVRTEEGGDYRWPGKIGAFNTAMRARKLSKLVSKGQASDSAGTATDLLTGERTRTVGTAEDPLNYFLGKQLETFPGFDPDEAWRTHPVSEDAAVTLMNAETFVEACTYRTFGADVYYLPYFLGKPDPEQAYDLYGVLHHAATAEDDESMTPVENTFRTLGDDVYKYGYRLRFYVAAVMKHQSKRFDVFGETMNGSILYPVDLARAHSNRLLESWVYDSTDRQYGRLTAPIPSQEKWDLVAGGDVRAHVRMIASGKYFFRTFPRGDDDTDASADDPRIETLVDVLSGEPLTVDSLLGEYVDRLLETDGEEFPTFVVAEQFAQLCALARADLLDADDPSMASITERPEYDTTRDMDTTEPIRADGGQSAGHARHRKLEQFIEETPALRQQSGDPEGHGKNAQRRGAFLLGALVGEVGSYQQWKEDRSTTLIDQYPVKSITQARIKKVTQEAIGKTLTYTRQDDKSITKFEWVVERLRETIVNPDPDDWDIGTDDLRFYYALGVTYGMNDRPESTDSESTDSE